MGFRRLNKAERVRVAGEGNRQAIRQRTKPKPKWVRHRARYSS